MRTWVYNKLTNNEIEEYLESDDTVLLPVGVTEMHGALPVDCENVLAQAIALRLADQINALVLMDLSYFYAGATALGRGTLQVSVRFGIDYLYEILKSLKRQGFRKFIFVSFHGPAYLTVSPVLRDFFDQYHLPVLYIDAIEVMIQMLGSKDVSKTSEEFDINNLFFGAYDILGRLEDIPLTTRSILDCSTGTNETARFDDLMKVGPKSGVLGFYCGNKQDHAPTPVVRTAEERQARADLGKELLDSMICWLNTVHIKKQMTQTVMFNNELFKHNGDWLNFN